MTARLPWLALLVLAVGLALHNVVMALAWGGGVRGGRLDVLAAWKDVLLLAALAVALWGARRVPFELWADRLAIGYAAVVVVWFLLPQDWLGGEATTRGQLLALRHHLLPVEAYLLGRLLVLSDVRWRRVGLVLVTVAVGLAAWGLVDVYAVGLQWWRDSGVPGWFGEQLGLVYACLSGLPENWILNTGDEDNPLRRLVSTFLSPLATAYVLVIVLLFLAARRPSRAAIAAATLVYAGLLWTHTRSALLALALGLVVLALAQRRKAPAFLAAGSVVVGVLFVAVFPAIGPSTSYTRSELACLRENAAREGDTSGALSGGDASTESHLRNLRDGVEVVLRHPWGYGLGNAGVTAKRTTPDRILAGESTFTELGVDAGLAGAALFAAWLVALVVGLWRRAPWLAASFAAMAAVALQTDLIGIHWIAVVLFGLGGAALSSPPPQDRTS